MSLSAQCRKSAEFDIRRNVGNKIKQLRRAANIKLSWLASHFGVDKGTMSRYLNGQILFPPTWVLRTSELLGVKPMVIAELYFGETGCLA